MTCNRCKNYHYITGITDNGTNVILTVSNSTNVASKQRFCLCVNRCISQAVTGSPLPVSIQVNGVDVPVYDKYSLPLTSEILARYHRCKVLGYYVVSGDSAYVIFSEIPYTNCDV